MDTLVIAPGRRTGLALLALVAVLVAVTVLSDPAGRLLSAPAAVAALVLALRELLAGPVLTADADGLAARQGWRTVTAPWKQVERMRVVQDRRAELLEVDLGSYVVLLSRTRLGRSPAEVLTQLQALRSR